MWRRWQDLTLVLVVALLMGLFAYAMYLSNRGNAEEEELLRSVQLLVERNAELARREQRLIEFICTELEAHHRILLEVHGYQVPEMQAC